MIYTTIIFDIFLEIGSYNDKSKNIFIFKEIFVYYKCHISIELTFLKELMLIKQANQKSAIFVTIAVFQIKTLNFNKMSAIDAMIY